MKKITYLFAAMVATLGFSACNETWDDNPQLATHEGDPVVEFLNTPAEANTALFITAEENKGTLKLTGSQPEQYGYAATVGYQVEMALNEDFTTPAATGDDIPASVILGTWYDLSNINPTLRSVAEGMCKMLGIQDASLIPTDYMPVYMRLRANVVNENNQAVEGTALTSNTICYKHVACGYLAIIVPGLPRSPNMYLRGDMNNWLNDQLNENINLELLPKYEFLTTTEADTYELDYVEIAKNQGFKVADKGWGDPNISTDGVIATYDTWLDCVWNAGNSSFSEDFKGSITVQGSGNSWKIMFTKAEPDEPGKASGIYVKGDFNSWADQSAYEFFTTDVKNTWKTNTVTITPGYFKVADASWTNPNLGSNGTEITIGTKYEAVFGSSDNIYLATAFQGVITLRHKGSKWIITLDAEN